MLGSTPIFIFSAIETIAKLLQKILNGLEMKSITLSPEMKLLSHIACEVASKQKTSSASMVEVAVKVCLTLFHQTAPTTKIKMYTDVDLRESSQPLKSASE